MILRWIFSLETPFTRDTRKSLHIDPKNQKNSNLFKSVDNPLPDKNNIYIISRLKIC